MNLSPGLIKDGIGVQLCHWICLVTCLQETDFLVTLHQLREQELLRLSGWCIHSFIHSVQCLRQYSLQTSRRISWQVSHWLSHLVLHLQTVFAFIEIELYHLQEGRRQIYLGAKFAERAEKMQDCRWCPAGPWAWEVVAQPGWFLQPVWTPGRLWQGFGAARPLCSLALVCGSGFHQQKGHWVFTQGTSKWLLVTKSEVSVVTQSKTNGSSHTGIFLSAQIPWLLLHFWHSIFFFFWDLYILLATVRQKARLKASLLWPLLSILVQQCRNWLLFVVILPSWS